MSERRTHCDRWNMRSFPSASCSTLAPRARLADAVPSGFRVQMAQPATEGRRVTPEQEVTEGRRDLEAPMVSRAPTVVGEK